MSSTRLLLAPRRSLSFTSWMLPPLIQAALRRIACREDAARAAAAADDDEENDDERDVEDEEEEGAQLKGPLVSSNRSGRGKLRSICIIL